MVRIVGFHSISRLILISCCIILSNCGTFAQPRRTNRSPIISAGAQQAKGATLWKAPSSVKRGISYIVDTHHDTLFSEVPTTMANLGHGTAAWGDYDNDGQLDILLTGICCRDSISEASSVHITKIYRNDHGSFVDINADLPGVNNNDGTIWADYDKDGFLDLFVCGATREPNADPVGRIYRNNNGAFVDVGAGLPGVVGTAAWGDFDNDGDLDLLVTGSPDNGQNFITRLFRNDNGIFHEVLIDLPGVWASSAAWGDFDNDGDLDLILTGYGTYGQTSKIYRNDGPSHDSSSWVFTDIGAPIQLVNSGSAACGDYDNDGNLDILYSGYTGAGGFSTIYKGDGHGNFVDIHPGLLGVGNSHVNWVDFDNDGDQDVLISGQTPTGDLITKIYRNDGPSPDSTSWVFTDLGVDLQGVYYSATAWGDYDNDGRLDLLVSGFSMGIGISPWLPLTRLYHNNIATPNKAPAPPDGLTAVVDSGRVVLGWNTSTDPETPQRALTYNISVSTTLTGDQIVSGMSDKTTGFHKVARIGNRNHATTWSTTGLPPGSYYWRVQAVDNVFAGSAFTSLQSFVVTGVRGEEGRPRRFVLEQNYPNPFNPATTIRYQLPERSRVRLSIYNTLGQLVSVLVDGSVEEGGEKSVTWNPANAGGAALASGVYYCRLEATPITNPGKTYREVKKMTVLR
jgi:hypothetical protein